MIITTSICANYLPKAMVLAKTVKKHNPKIKVVICLLEDKVPRVASDFLPFDEIVLAKDLGFENFNKYIFKHSIVEASTSVKGQLFVYMLDKYKDEDKFVYLDPDIAVYGELNELDNALDSNDIVLTPHLTHPEDSIDAVMDNELCALQHGVFNLGFLAIKRSSEGIRFAEWWRDRLGMFCYDDIPRGIFTDQKWVDLAPCFFNVYILKHPGYNAAPWNVSKRKISKRKDMFYANDEPLKFFHFSGFDSGANEGMINKYVPDRSDAIYTLRSEYVKDLDNAGQEEIGNMPWFYNTFSSGEKIERSSRIRYREDCVLQSKIQNPFNCGNKDFTSAIICKNKSISLKRFLRKVYRRFFK